MKWWILSLHRKHFLSLAVSIHLFLTKRENQMAMAVFIIAHETKIKTGLTWCNACIYTFQNHFSRFLHKKITLSKHKYFKNHLVDKCSTFLLCRSVDCPHWLTERDWSLFYDQLSLIAEPGNEDCYYGMPLHRFPGGKGETRGQSVTALSLSPVSICMGPLTVRLYSIVSRLW